MRDARCARRRRSAAAAVVVATTAAVDVRSTCVVSQAARAAVAGALAECGVLLALYPLDTLRTRLHVTTKAQCGKLFAGLGAGLPGCFADAAVFSFVFAALRGCAPNCDDSGNGDHDVVASSVHVDKPVRRGARAAIAAGVAALASTVVETPFLVARDRVRLGHAPHALAAWHTALRARGVRGLYTGAMESFTRDAPLEMAQFGTFELLRCAMARAQGKKHLNGGETMAVALVSGAMVGAALAPLDVVVTRVVASPARYCGVVRTARALVREEGVGVLFRGARFKVLREALSSALFFPLFEHMVATWPSSTQL
ncbi:unnamed protein product [Agarophyton chilense]|eukprot:gb/GEZJ01005268.1/.p1 GENE.gb/GEZJ01005268.1/~~gb/GEZJ01005268.1/.p1  ORF type:complete len:313 (-),score=37.58 gb/GEZJ01005268.1/:155-1093(-)